ncbi:TetR/AcrR family transcriptional regulator [Specibacter cremeus]|uniref:TetR/AcrR family transcriptional regulator n=1 Tax=Specibacter cremeus TaxID=1629051 RepID=UPI000F76C9D6|nr:TetR family transcriptional regulator C-terminal domain-containing protein [Specibacter cremeus]
MPKIVDAADRRDHVADALYRVVLAKGLAAVSLRNVAREAELALGSVRHYFDNQADLLEAAFALNSERVHARALDALEAFEQAGHADRDELLAGAAGVLEEFLPLDEGRAGEAVVHMEFMLAARADDRLADVARDDYRATAAVVGRVILQLIDGGAMAAGRSPVGEAERLMAVLDGLALRLVLQPAWATPAQGSATLCAHLASLGADQPE